ncbi:MAG: hypothetical protein GXY73_02810 [Methanothrix sp.]|jgi:hypothetical protein|nr:hypothetical protein [Methanothrix sp.]
MSAKGGRDHQGIDRRLEAVPFLDPQREVGGAGGVQLLDIVLRGEAAASVSNSVSAEEGARRRGAGRPNS